MLAISEMVDVDLMKQILCFLIRMSDDGMGTEAYSHEEMRKRYSFCCCRYNILVVTVGMADVET